MALASGLLWLVLSLAVESLFTGSMLGIRSAGRGMELTVLGILLCAIVAGITYSAEATARPRALERRDAAPPIDPARAVEAAELAASLLRVTVEEGGDEVSLADEWAFVSRYLELKHVCFGDRLRVCAEVGLASFDAAPRVVLLALKEE